MEEGSRLNSPCRCLQANLGDTAAPGARVSVDACSRVSTVGCHKDGGRTEAPDSVLDVDAAVEALVRRPGLGAGGVVGEVDC